MKQYSFFVAVLLFLLSLSCSKEPGQNPQLSSEIQDLLAEEAPLEKEDLSLKSPGCNCSYKVIDFKYTMFSEVGIADDPDQIEQPPIEAVFWSGSKCKYGELAGCHLFSGLFPGVEKAGYSSCFHNWKTLPPDGLFPFNCEVPAYSSFPVSVSVLSSKVASWSLTFKIFCQDATPMTNCMPGGAYGYESEPVTLSYPPIKGSDKGYVKLGKCGCKPKAAVGK